MHRDSRHIIQTIRAKSDGEVRAHQLTRLAFLQDVTRDERTRDLYERWGASTGLDGAIAGYAAALDLAAMHADLGPRQRLHGNTAALARLPASVRDSLLLLARR